MSCSQNTMCGCQPPSPLPARQKLCSSADGPEIAGTGISLSRRYTPSCARWWMVWLIMNERKHTMRGIVKTVLPPWRKAQFAMKCSSLAPAMAARAEVTALSKSSSSSFFERWRTGGRNVEGILLNKIRRPAHHVGDVSRQRNHGERFGMRAPVELVFRHAFQGLPGAGHLLVKLG